MTNPATASAFANWVFQRHHPADASFLSPPTRKDRLQLGAATHRDIQLFLTHRWCSDTFGEDGVRNWTLFYADSHEDEERVFVASALTVGSRPLTCRPDVVLTRHDGREILIIERKTTFVPEERLHSCGWQNIEAQLWAYSYIDDFRTAGSIILIGQLWTRYRGHMSLCQTHPAWRKDDPSHERRCQQWFADYAAGAGAR